MSTIVDIIRNYVETHNNVNTIIFSSIAKSGEIKRGETQRDRLYKVFIKKQLNISDDDIIFRNGNYWVDISQQKESLNEGKKEDIRQNIIELSKFLKEKLELPYLPKVKFINNDAENEKDPLGRTAYYDPSIKTIVLYTLGRHPKDITRSFSHEMIHFKQDLENRLNNIHTQNVNEDDYLAELEREAYEKGNMLLRSWENGKRLNEIKISTPGQRLLFGLRANNKWTELIKAYGFKTKGDALKKINEIFNRDEYPFYIMSGEETDKIPNPCYIYVLGDGEVAFQGQFTFDGEEDWGVEKWSSEVPLREIKISTPSSITPKIHKVESLKDTEYFDADTYMYLLDLGKYYTFVPQGGDFDNPANKLYLISKDIVKKTEDQNDSDLVRFNNDLKSLDLKDYLSNIQKNGIEHIK